jgi:hypothetical protein
MNNAPFAIGQKVVALKTGICLVKGREYTITGVYPSDCKCNGWDVTVGISWSKTHHQCEDCGVYNIPNSGTEKLFLSGLFAPIQTNYADATAEILEKFKSPSETPDKINIPEPCNNPLQ